MGVRCKIAVWPILLLAVCICATGEASAQESSSPLPPAYGEALERGDLAAAEAAVSAALQHSEQRDGEGGGTAALAFALAHTRVLQGRWLEAKQPAQRAHDLARARGAVSGVDLLRSRLLLGRIRLSEEGLDAASFVSAALDEAKTRADLAPDRYEAAEQFGLWAMGAHRYHLARTAWAFAAEAAQGAPYDAQFARGRARIYEGVAIAMTSMTRDVVLRGQVAREVRERFEEAQPLVQPFALLDTPDGALAEPHRIYALMLAWDTAIWSKMTAETPRGGRSTLRANPAAMEGAPVCAIAQPGPALQFPAGQRREGQLGAVVVRLRFSEAGTMLGADIAASVGHEGFERLVADAIAQWRTSADTSNPPGCRVRPVLYVPVAFSYRQ
jgi:TonB family protein